MVKLTIGIPAYNNAKTLPAALESLLAQSFRDFRIVISDDTSRDDTVQVAERYAAQDPRVTVIRQPRNLGYTGNFVFVLRQADTPMFMWACADDRWDPDFVAANVAALEADPSLIGSVSRAEFVRDGKTVATATGTFPIRGTPEERLALFLSGLADRDTTRLFAVYRTARLQKVLPLPDTFTFDNAVCALAAFEGNYHEVPRTMLWRDRTPSERYFSLMLKEAPAGPAGWFPGLAMTRWLLRERKIPRTRHILLALLASNVEWHLAFTSRYHPRYAALVGPAGRFWHTHLNWRCRRQPPRAP
jgi:glycosyltransferase involved in cell wall biosynthesis